MKYQGDHAGRDGEDIADDDTVELVVLQVEDAVLEESAADGEDTGTHVPPSQAFLWLKHMEAELDRLQSRWSEIDVELGERDARIADLSSRIENRDHALGDITSQLEARAAAVAALESELGGLRAALAEREAALAAKGEQLRALSESQQAAERADAQLRAKLAAAQGEIAQLQAAGTERRTEYEGLAGRFASLSQNNHGLLGRIQDLELYIEGRKKDWTEQSAKIAKYRADLADIERGRKSKEKEHARREKDEQKLNDQILELERRCSELIGRRRERDDAYQEIETKLAEQIKATEQLRSELNLSQSSAAKALDEAAGRDQLVEALRGDLAQRDRAIADLEEAVAAGQRSLAELTEQQAALIAAAERQQAEIIAEAERQQAQITAAAERKHADLIAAAERSQAELIAAAERRQAEHVAEAERKDAAFEALRGELEKATRERAQLDAELAAAKEKLGELELSGASRVDEIRGLNRELAARQAEVRRLEAELEQRRQTMSLLDQNMRRINILGASLQRMDRSEKPSAASAPGEERSQSNVHYLGSAEGSARTRRMLVSVEGHGNLTFPLQKQNTTIGRSRRSDIRINGQFVSRIHARVLTNAIGTIIEDLGSKNGLLVNAEPVTRRVLQDGDIVSLGGKLDLKYVELDA